MLRLFPSLARLDDLDETASEKALKQAAITSAAGTATAPADLVPETGVISQGLGRGRAADAGDLGRGMLSAEDVERVVGVERCVARSRDTLSAIRSTGAAGP